MSTLPELVCQYCGNRNTGADSRCTHCGAPLRAAVNEVKSVAEGKLPHQLAGVAEKVGAEAEKAVAETKKIVGRSYPLWQWRAVGIGILVMIVAAVLGARSCSMPLPSMPRTDTPAQAMPDQLRSAAVCQPLDDSGRGEKCVIAAGHPMLFGGIAGGRDLTFYAELMQPNQLADTISRWRSARGAALVDGPVYAAIGPSATVWYADTRVGLRVETATFAGQVAAKTFVSRAGLVR
ncbi:hypothetical protein OHA40_08375 [Nocardia sp. NBC_00508]|uniref:hypothetical protein n=1 Tax=Nocardia sp. NBC_00508 TaxID=2975992 RepID=UPI002E812E22|nr:hypothetical protein [Nocardia sp. NBC_00508]WUD68118.1 hypothetical protein OHA40_08375 [Nocardia sp. NBC_00508]